MRKGFTILELLVASLILGMLVTILTMIFNQSSIAWRTGVAGVSQMDEARENIAALREESDNLFFHGNKACLLVSLWDKNGNLRTRACGESGVEDVEINMLSSLNGSSKGKSMTPIAVGSGAGGKSGAKSYTVGVTSYGPDGEEGTYDDITTWPELKDLL